ncbi:MAG: hypothetical protein IPJ88_02570 [Myxococcales bacterium]|nr:MAG: hypothetical protein IPJ88_02570 [Myxococcales bacterium]
MVTPDLAYGTPRKLPKPKSLDGSVVVLDIAFATEVGGASFNKVTRPFIEGLGDRLLLWVDHHDHDLHVQYEENPRFFLRSKAQHGACPEMITEELVEQYGQPDTICCHVDFDGLCAAAKWIRGGKEPYAGADHDAWAIDTRLGKASEQGMLLDRALRAHPRDNSLKDVIVDYLVHGAEDRVSFRTIEEAATDLAAMEKQSEALAQRYQISGEVAVVDTTQSNLPYDKTWLLLLGQQKAAISIVYDAHTVTAAARFDSGINLLRLLGLSGGMPTRVSVSRQQLQDVLDALDPYRKKV